MGKQRRRVGRQSSGHNHQHAASGRDSIQANEAATARKEKAELCTNALGRAFFDRNALTQEDRVLLADMANDLQLCCEALRNLMCFPLTGFGLWEARSEVVQSILSHMDRSTKWSYSDLASELTRTGATLDYALVGLDGEMLPPIAGPVDLGQVEWKSWNGVFYVFDYGAPDAASHLGTDTSWQIGLCEPVLDAQLVEAVPIPLEVSDGPLSEKGPPRPRMWVGQAHYRSGNTVASPGVDNPAPSDAEKQVLDAELILDGELGRSAPQGSPIVENLETLSVSERRRRFPRADWKSEKVPASRPSPEKFGGSVDRLRHMYASRIVADVVEQGVRSARAPGEISFEGDKELVHTLERSPGLGVNSRSHF